jgi:hypothetical protein
MNPQQRLAESAERAKLVGILACLAGLSLALVVLGCGGTASGEDGQAKLSPERAKAVLQELPYRYEFRSPKVPHGASGALAGRVHGAHKTWLEFGVALGDHADPVPVPWAGISNAVGNPGFVFTTDDLIPVGRLHWANAPQLKTRAQEREASRMATDMEEQLCLAITGEPCPV